MANRMREKPLVAHVIDRLPPDGAERLLVDVLRHRSQDYRYVVLCLVGGGPMEEELAKIDVQVVVFGKKHKIDVGLLIRLIHWFRKHRPEVVHTHLFTADTWGRLAALAARVPGIFATIHSINIWKTGVHRAVDWCLAKVSTKLVACAPQVERSLIEDGRISPDKILTISNGIDLDRFEDIPPLDLVDEFSAPRRAVTIALIGRLHTLKGHLDLLQALVSLKRRSAQFHVFFVGEGEHRDEIAARSRDLKLNECVTFTGLRSDIPSIMVAIDIVVMPSHWEGLPMTLLEAMASGRAIVATSVGGIPDVITDDYNGILVPPREPAALERALNDLMQDEERRKRLGKHARATVTEKYNAAHIIKKYEALYKEVQSKAG